MSVRPVLLGLYEKYFLPLQKLLLPSLQAFIIGLLPGLEEGSEIYDRWVSASLTPLPHPGWWPSHCVLCHCCVRIWGKVQRCMKQGEVQKWGGRFTFVLVST